MLKMGHLSGQPIIANSLPAVQSALFCGSILKRLDISLLVETSIVTLAAIWTIRVFEASFISGAAWFVAPAILVAAALIPTVIRRSKFVKIGFDIKQVRVTLPVVCGTCVVVFPAMFCGLWLLKSCGLELPLRAMLPQNQQWLRWLFYQFLYVAVAEEVFFRGYVQSNILSLINTAKGQQYRLQQWASISISAAVFAGAHIIIQGQIISILTFLPGLILGWLFVRTRSLLAPLLFHGLANTCYFVMVAVLA